jgi:glycosyltransferase involved in cell wall biosynthesis
MPPQPAGAGIYAIELVRAMAERDRRDGYALFVRGNALDAALDGRATGVGASVVPGRRGWREQVRLPRALSALGIDVLHSTHHTLPLAGVRCRRVVTIHDVTFFRIPGRYPPARRLYMQTLTRLAAKVADAIIVPSNTVRDDAHRTLGVAESRSTVYEAAAAYALERGAALAVAREYGIDAPYVLSVGSLEPGKNRARLFRAMRALRDEGFEHQLVVVGQKAWKYEEEMALVDELRMRDRIVFPGYVKQEHLRHSTRRRRVRVPSLYRGSACR